MKTFKKFKDFLEGKKVQEIDAADGLAGKDYDGPLALKPEQEPTKGKKDKTNPYKASGEEQSGVVWTAPDDGSKKGLAQNASPGMTPQTSPLGKKVDDSTKARPKPKKLTAEQFVEETKNLSNAQFFDYVLESHGDAEISPVTDLFGNEFTPDPIQTIQYMSGLFMGNSYYLEKFVREMRRRGGMDSLMDEVCNCGGYDLVVNHLEDPDHGEDRSKGLAKSLNDRFMKAVDNFAFDGEDDDTNESVAPSLDMMMGKQQGMGMPQMPSKPQGGATGGGSGPDGTPDPNYQGGVFSKDGGASNPMGAANPGMRNPKGGGGMGVMGGMQTPNFGNGPVMPPKKMKEGDDDNFPRFKGRSAGIHLINELSGFPHFKRHMKSRCTGPDCP